VAEKLMQMLPLDMRIYTPQMSAERWNVLYGGVPQLDDPELHEQFSRSIKVEPFNRAIRELAPELWLTGIRRDETEFRRTLDIVSWDERRGLLRVAPIFNWRDEQVQSYMASHALPSCKHYFDPTKVLDNRECGIHTGL
jgi:phosphoadenosine phosphosulfate reductase